LLERLVFSVPQGETPVCRKTLNFYRPIGLNNQNGRLLRSAIDEKSPPSQKGSAYSQTRLPTLRIVGKMVFAAASWSTPPQRNGAPTFENAGPETIAALD
jgi:hypothetical protein